MSTLYKTDFSLTGVLSDKEPAKEWFEEQGAGVLENMQQYIRTEHGDQDFSDVITSIQYTLNDEEHGRVTVECSRDLTEDELECLTDGLEREHEYGIGERFNDYDFDYIDIDPVYEDCGLCIDTEYSMSLERVGTAPSLSDADLDFAKDLDQGMSQ